MMKGGINYKSSRDEGELFSGDTEKCSASLHYDRKLNDTFKGAIGAVFPLIRYETTELVVSVSPTLQRNEGGSGCNADELGRNTYPGGTFTTQLNWVANPSFKLNLENNMNVLATESEAKPTNSFTALIKYFPSFNSGSFTSLKFESVYNSIADPEVSNTVTGQLRLEF